MEPIFFPDPAALRAWFAAHHATAAELIVGYHKTHTGLPSITWSKAVDEALCVGWIDGVAHRIDAESHRQRYTPRRPGSTWSAVNVAKVAELTAQGRMLPAGLAAFAARTEARTATYSHEQGELELTPQQRVALEADPAAAAFFDAQPRTYRRAAIWWVLSAKREETTARRLAALAAESAAGRRLAQFTSPPRR